MKTRTRRWIIIGVIIVIIAGMFAYPRIKRRRQADESNKALTTVSTSVPRSRALNVNAEIVSYTPMDDKAISPGNLIPFEEADLSFETSGKIVGIYFNEGEFVKKGTLLAKINDLPLQAQLKKLEAQVKLAEDRVYRQQTLLEKDAVSREAYETVATEYEKLMADIELIKANIAQTELRAPFDGRIGLRYVSEGAYVTPSANIANIAMTNTLKLDFFILETYARDIKPGTKVIFSFRDDRGRLHEHTATVYALESTVEQGTYTLRARATFPNELENLVPGTYVSVEILRDEIKDALSVPSEAIIPEMGRNIVYVVRNGKAQPVEIETGIRNEARVQAISGLQLGDTLITSGVMQLRTGMDVVLNNIN